MRISEVLKPGALELTELDAVDEDQLLHALKTHHLTFKGHDLHKFLDEAPGEHTLEMADTLAQQLDAQDHPDQKTTRPHVHDGWWYYTELLYRPKEEAVYGVLQHRVTYKETSYRNRRTVFVPLCFKSTDGVTVKSIKVTDEAGKTKQLMPTAKSAHLPKEADDIDLEPYFGEFFKKTPP